MGKVVHIYSMLEELQEIFTEGVESLDRALECFMMREKQDSASALMAKKTYKLIQLAEDIIEWHTPEGVS